MLETRFQKISRPVNSARRSVVMWPEAQRCRQTTHIRTRDELTYSARALIQTRQEQRLSKQGLAERLHV